MDYKTGSVSGINRRQLLGALGAGLAGVATAGSGPAAAQAQRGSITIENQNSDGTTLVLDAVSTPTDGEVFIQDQPEEGSNTIFGATEVTAGTDERNLAIDLETEIQESQMVEAWLIDGSRSEGEFEPLDIDEAFVSVDDDVDAAQFGVTYVDANPEYGFNYPYYLYTPFPEETGDREKPILVEPNNTGTATDDFQVHRDRAEQRISGGGISREVSETLEVPLLVPVFPRPRTDPVDGTHYVHALDETTLRIDDGPLERVDLQLLRMADHATTEFLADTAYSFSDQFMLNGFSASGNFVDRFTVLHADRVLSVTAGGLNGMALLPLAEMDGHTLPFHVGIADAEALTGSPVDLAALDEVNQLLFMGEEDTNDTIPYDDAWTDDKLRQTALAVYGDDMITERFPKCQEAYTRAGIDAQFKIYREAGHTPRPAEEDIVEFHRRSLDGEDVTEFGERIVTRATFETTPEAPAVETPVEFDASASAAGVGEILTYTWDFGDGDTAVGETVSHAFEATGSYTVTLTLVTDSGDTAEASADVRVVDGTDTVETDTAAGAEPTEQTADDGTGAADTETTTGTEPTEPTADQGTEASGESGPGFGIAGTLASIGSVAYVLRRRLRDEPSER